MHDFRFGVAKLFAIAVSAAIGFVVMQSKGVRAQEAAAAAASPSETIIHYFGYSASASATPCQTPVADGAAPVGSLTYISSSGLLFGRTTTTVNARPAGGGVIFQSNTDGSDYQIDHTFPASVSGTSPDDGFNPRHDSMTIVGDQLFGTALEGGESKGGVIFSIGNDGGNYAFTPHQFDAANVNPTNWGAAAHSCFVNDQPAGLLYGMTSEGGTQGSGKGNGVIFSFNPVTDVYTPLYDFDGAKNGSDPHGAPILDPSGTTLYGMTREGGKSNQGAIFSFSLTTKKIKNLHSFSCTPGSKGACISAHNGATSDHGKLVQAGKTLYGVTSLGGKYGYGVIFSIHTNGTLFKVLHSFGAPVVNDGQNPFGSLLLDGTTLYGMTQNGGTGGLGTVFSIQTSGKNYVKLYDFQGQLHGFTDGANPIDNVIKIGNTLYGMTENGGCGKSGGNGVIFALALPGS